MSVTIRNFGGPIIWMLRKNCSNLTSKVMLTGAAFLYNQSIKKYINYFMSGDQVPLFLNCMVETINRCNGLCSFCPSNVKDERRPFKRMEESVFQNLVFQLKQMNWKGTMYLNINNEPFMDTRILSFAAYAKREISGIRIAIISNGTLISMDSLNRLSDVVDELIINDYSDYYRLSDKHKRIYEYIKSNQEKFGKTRVIINRRYGREILATRAGNAPNKHHKNNRINTPCIYPFTDILVYPDGKVGMCCNDCFEEKIFGDITKECLIDIWRNKEFYAVRNAMLKGNRQNYPYCCECDVVDAGEREEQIKSLMRD